MGIEQEQELIKSRADEYSKISERKQATAPKIRLIMNIVEAFLRKSKRICYGGTAINNILPKADQFYDPEYDIPDYDFFSPDPTTDVETLVDMYADLGYTNVEGKPGIHAGTFKVFVDFIGVADITYIPEELFNALYKEAIVIKGIRYSHPNYLRMAAYLELSRPEGDVSRWEKVFKRIQLLNKNYPLKMNIPRPRTIVDREDMTWNRLVIDYIIDNKLVFFGIMANRFLDEVRKSNQNLAQFFISPKSSFANLLILSDKAEASSLALSKLLKKAGYPNQIIKQPALGEIIPEHYQIVLEGNDIKGIFIYQTLACHSFYKIPLNHNKEARVASIETLLSFYLAFIWTQRDYYIPEQILYVCEGLIELSHQIPKLIKNGLTPYPLDCIGVQLTKEGMMEHTQQRRKELANNEDDPEYPFYYFKYKAPIERRSKSRKRRSIRTI